VAHRLVVSDQHAGLVVALRRAFQGVAHQRCRVHFIRNLLAHVPKAQVDMVAAVLRTIFVQPDPDSMATTWDQARDQLASRFAKVGPLMDEAKAEVLAFNAKVGGYNVRNSRRSSVRLGRFPVTPDIRISPRCAEL
jgi:transposase-like protein